jgi:rfaE bifunctional protein nucleotidyltransferase chain/domain
MTQDAKVISLQDLAGAVAKLKAAGKTVVHCHGVFDLLHIGHIRHFECARKLGDALVVTLTPDEFVNKGPGRPVFTQALRAEAIASLKSVDYVAINEWPNAIETVKLIKPSKYVKGSDYKDASKDLTGGIALEQAAVESVGGKLVFTDEITFSSSSLLNRHASDLSEEALKFIEGCVGRHGSEKILSYLQTAANLKVLVIGETIIDEYQYCEAIGKSSKEPTLAVKALNTEIFAGGIIAVANHIASFAGKTGMISFLGDTNPREDFVRSKLSPTVDTTFLYRKDSPTITKRRLVEQYYFMKLMEVYEINDGPLSADDEDAFCKILEREVPKYDLVVVVDFGHSMLTQKSRDYLSTHAKFLAVNTQANAGNLGYHTISEYSRADYISLADGEMRLEGRDRRSDIKPMMLALSKKLSCPRVVVTQGSKGCTCYHTPEGFVRVPPVATKVVDRVGAGDTFLALSALCAVQGAPMDIVGFVGTAAGAQAVATVGHRRYIERSSMLKHLEVLMK